MIARSISRIRAGIPLLVIAAVLVAGCGEWSDGSAAPADLPSAEDEPLFTKLSSAYTGVDFANRLEDTQEFNVFTYRNYYNGAGVAVGDLTGNGLPDLYLTSNQGENRLYLNEGDFRFRNVTEAAGVAGAGVWSTCAVMADVNGNGLLDLYVCYSGDVDGSMRANELYINQGLDEDGVPVFEEQAVEYGVDDEGYSIHAVFFDYTKDGNLDLYVLNNSFRSVGSFGMRNLRNVRDENGGDRLYRNDGSTFRDVSEEAGIYGSEIAFGLGVAVGDLNNNGWPDIYVSNDFFERDYLYENNKDGTFTEVLEERLPYISHFSMGSDVADINNNGYLDLFVTDMLQADNHRLKTQSSFEGWDIYQTRKRLGYHHQYMRNMLHMNNADGTFSDIGRMAGVEATDWSWSALIADFDLDGHKDIFVTNGLYKDLTEQDFISYLANEQRMELMSDGRVARGGNVDYLSLIDMMTSTPISNYAFRNEGDLTFSSVAGEWGLDEPSFSHGAAYADLNGDGALDLIVSNTNDEVSIYRNNIRSKSENRFLQVDLRGEGANRFGLGAKVTIEQEGQRFHQEQMPMRGFQSSVDLVLTFGVGLLDTLELVTITWPDDRVQKVSNVATNQRLVVDQREADPGNRFDPDPATTTAQHTLIADVTDEIGVELAHQENNFVDFDRDRLIPKMLSREGPALAVGDATGNGLDDFFLGGAKGYPGTLMLQQHDGSFEETNADIFELDSGSEDVDAVFFDATGNGYLDLYVVSGGNEFSTAAPELQDRLYLNDGRGGFTAAPDHLPARYISGSVAVAGDVDGDGHPDLFVGGRVIPWEYGRDPESAILRNDGSGRFVDVTDDVAPELAELGMVTDAMWTDVDGNGHLDLVVVGEWMPITVFSNRGDGTLARDESRELAETYGWWNTIEAADLNGNGRTDFIVGNFGRNGRLQPSKDEPVTMYVDDFNRNGSVEQIVSYFYEDGASYPLKLRNDIVQVLPDLRSAYPTYADYADASVYDMFDDEQLARAVKKKAYTFDSAIIWNNGDGSYRIEPLPALAQIAPIYGIAIDDVTQDGNLDVLVAGNFHGLLPEMGRMGASWGLMLAGDGSGSFTPVPAAESGFRISGETRHLQTLHHAQHGSIVLAARNDDATRFFRLPAQPASEVATRE